MPTDQYEVHPAVIAKMERTGFEVHGGRHLRGNTHVAYVSKGGLGSVVRYEYDNPESVSTHSVEDYNSTVADDSEKHEIWGFVVTDKNGEKYELDFPFVGTYQEAEKEAIRRFIEMERRHGPIMESVNFTPV